MAVIINCFTDSQQAQSIPILCVAINDYESWLTQQDAGVQDWLAASQFQAKPKSVALIPSAAHTLAAVVFVVEPGGVDNYLSLSASIPAGDYHFDLSAELFAQADQLQHALIAWGLAQYQFDTYKTDLDVKLRMLAMPAKCDKELIVSCIESFNTARDWINTPAEDLGPSDIADSVQQQLKGLHAKVNIVKGDRLLKENFPTIHRVGQGSHRESHLIDITWGDRNAPKVTLVGKGICFDTGGLDIKNSAGMRYMKKDMGGAAHAFALAKLIMTAQLPIQLRVLLASADNAVSAKSMRPGDVVRTRSGKTVEIHNTDAEGRLVICDALAAAVEEQPEYLIDFTTLTGAARVALGPDVAVMLCNDDEFSHDVISAGEQVADPIWRLPLHQPYKRYLTSEVADISNASPNAFAGAITAGLYLQEFVPDSVKWMHFDVVAWNFDKQAGFPVGANLQGLRAVYQFLQDKFTKQH